MLKFIEMTVVAHDIGSPDNDGTINELIVIRVGGDKIETIGRIYSSLMWL